MNAGAGFGQALQTYLAGKADDQTPTARLVIQGDQPCTFVLTAFDTASSFAVDGFAFPALVASDLTDDAGLARRIAGAGDPVSAFLRTAIGSAALLDGLNGVISGVTIYEAQRFAAVTLDPQTQAALVAGGSPARLNRLLLQDAYPDAIAWPSANRVLRFPGAQRRRCRRRGAAACGSDSLEGEALDPGEPGGGSSRAPEPAEAGDSRNGVHIGADGTTAVSVPVGEAISATGIALPLVALVAATEVTVELREDFQGAPSGKKLRAGTAVLATPGTVERATVFFDPSCSPRGLSGWSSRTKPPSWTFTTWSTTPSTVCTSRRWRGRGSRRWRASGGCGTTTGSSPLRRDYHPRSSASPSASPSAAACSRSR